MQSIIFATLVFSFITAAPAETAQPYAGHEQRSLKALSDEEIADLRAGRGMGMALAAELNGYPGPLHVLELADELSLSLDQRQEVEEIHADMQAEASALGALLIEQEAGLDRAFAERTVTPASLSATLLEIGRLQAELRATHLRHHLTTAAALTPEQIAHYAALRGYASPHGQHGRH